MSWCPACSATSCSNSRRRKPSPPPWGSGILTELDHTLAKLHERRGINNSEDRRRHLLDQMQHAFPRSGVHAPKGREYDYGLDDPDDGHVAHAAMIGKADAIVTDDERAGFTTASVLIDANIETVSAAQFAANTVAAHPEAGMRALVAMSKRHINPPQSPAQILDLLVDRHGMQDVADILRPLLTALR